MLRVIMQKRPTTPRINDGRRNSRRNQELLDCLKTNKMAAKTPKMTLRSRSEPVHRKQNQNWEKPSLMQYPRHQVRMPECTEYK